MSLEDIFGPAVSAPIEAPTSAADLTVILLASAAALAGRNSERGRLSPRQTRPAWTRLAPPAALEATVDSPVSAPAEAPTSAAELTIVLLPCSSGRPRPGAKSKRGRISRPWTRPPGAGPP